MKVSNKAKHTMHEPNAVSADLASSQPHLNSSFPLLPLHLHHRKHTIFLALPFSRILLATFAVPLG